MFFFLSIILHACVWNMLYLQNSQQNIVSIINKQSLGLSAQTNAREDEVLDWWRERFELSTCSDVAMETDSYVTCLALEDIEQR